MWAYLLYIKGLLAAIPGIKTCKIGFEPNTTPNDYPMIRLVPSAIKGISGTTVRRKMSILIYFGLDIYESQVGTEELDHQMMLMEQLIRNATKVGSGFTPTYVKTLFDEGKLNTPYRLMIVCIDIEGTA